MPRYLMRSTVIVPRAVAEMKHGQTAARDAVVDLPESYGDHLVRERVAVRQDDAQSDEVPDQDADRAAGIAEIIELLDDDAFGTDGKPDVRKINEAMPEGSAKVTAAERDAVWDGMEPAEQ